MAAHRTRRIIAVVAAVALGGAATAGFVAFATGGGATRCDTDELAAAMHAAIARGDHAGAAQVPVELPAGCDADDMMALAPSVTRSWHVMPDGTMMRAAEHTNP